MKPSIADKRSVAEHSGATGKRRERFFYVGISVIIAATVFAGFAPTYFLKSYFASPPLMPLLHLHGLVFTSWIVLLLTQTTLVAANRTDIHRRLGIVGGVIAVIDGRGRHDDGDHQGKAGSGSSGRTSSAGVSGDPTL